MFRRSSAAVLCLALAASPAAGEDALPVLLELFTSEGCSSCPPADLLLARVLAEDGQGGHLIALGEHVDYWDQLGWKDRFSSPVFTTRQEAYAKTLRSGIFTPQLVVNGGVSLLGSDARAVRAAISSSRGLQRVRIDLRPPVVSDDGVDVDFAATWTPGAAGEIYVALVQGRTSSSVSRGENAGRTLTHVAVARSLARVGKGAGAYSGRARFSMAQWSEADRLVVFVQEPDGGPVEAAGTAGLR